MRLDHLLSKEQREWEHSRSSVRTSRRNLERCLILKAPELELRERFQRFLERGTKGFQTVGEACCEHGGVAQMGEHLPCKQGVDSSNLFISTRGLDERSPDRVLPDMGS